MTNVEKTMIEVRGLLAQAVTTLDRALGDHAQEYLSTDAGISTTPGSDWPKIDLSQLSIRKSIQRWLELLPDKRTASPAEIKRGLQAARPSKTDNQGTIQQLIYGLAQEGKIRREGWGEYGALLQAEPDPEG